MNGSVPTLREAIFSNNVMDYFYSVYSGVPSGRRREEVDLKARCGNLCDE